MVNQNLNGFSIVDVIGQVVYQSNSVSSKTKLDISHLNQGVYFVKLNVGGSEITRKIILTK
ncbi:MAG: T9SS type A sorting domain-containing protein [Bacteroidales bacterium]|nr:T9SS type A sorting domain-containing protein [Bacteroidales bacterium]